MKKNRFAYFKTILVTVSLVIVSFSNADAAPVITGVQGSFFNGERITIAGSGFGAGPNVILFDDFEGGVVGQQIQLSAPTLGSYYDLGSNRPFYTDVTSVSGLKSMRTNNANGYSTHVGVSFQPTTEFFASWWCFIPAGTNYPGEGVDAGINWKVVWAMGSGSTDDDQAIPTVLAANSAYITANDSPYHKWIGWPMQKGQWMRLNVWIQAGTPGQANGAIKMFAQRMGFTTQTLVNERNVRLLKSGGAYEKIHFNGYGRQTNNSLPTFDDIYAAVGSNAQARLEIGNSSNYAESTKLAIITPNAWSNNQITATVRQGAFTAGENAYLFAIDSEGIVSAGYPFVFGGQVSIPTYPSPSPTPNPTPVPSAPTPPGGLRIVN